MQTYNEISIVINIISYFILSSSVVLSLFHYNPQVSWTKFKYGILRWLLSWPVDVFGLHEHFIYVQLPYGDSTRLIHIDEVIRQAMLAAGMNKNIRFTVISGRYPTVLTSYSNEDLQKMGLQRIPYSG
jgi:hypothetical protein